ncbi:GNAT family N-acetyltransferase [Paeniglutamicibacter sp. MACA_103]|uniref:GNAT family N-acetyltransferase n=1 Tax=Paeniglutamicibacter sp. MACA_103 TaxID=3377337 RepID=UPI003893981C
MVEHGAVLHIDGLEVAVRDAVQGDLPALLAMLADDPLGASRDPGFDADLEPYLAAFAAIDRDPAHRLLVCESAGQVVAMLQLSFIPGLSRRGAWRAQIEAVRTHADFRGRGLGQGFIQWAIGHARDRGCSLVQLTTDKSRSDAHRFYERLGFEASHEGMKLVF